MKAVGGGIRECIIGHPVEVPDTMESIGPDRIVGGIVGGGFGTGFAPDRGNDRIVSG